jgi:hypothetical protein
MLCVAIMVKNEEERIIRTLSSVIKQVCFIDFSYNRNILLKMCRGLSDFILLLDANDEVKKPRVLANFLRNVTDNRDFVFGCKFVWENDGGIEGNNRTYYKIGVIRNNMDDIYYEFPIHEYITSSSPGSYVSNNNLYNTDFYIYQDRSKDKSSVPRIENDIAILNKYVDENPDNTVGVTRAYRFLCQSHNVLKNLNELNDCAKKLHDIVKDTSLTLDNKFEDYYYYSLMTIGQVMHELNMNGYEKYYLEAHKHSKLLFDNAEPFYRLSSDKFSDKEYEIAYAYIKKCIGIEKPGNIYETQINYEIYDKHRWSLLMQLAERLNKDDDYKMASMKLYGTDDLVPLSKSKTTIDDLTPKQQDAIRKVLEQNNIGIKPKSQDELKESTVGFRLFIIIAINNDDNRYQVNSFINYMDRYLTKLEIDHKIIVVKQFYNGEANYGIMYNMAVNYIKSLGSTDNVYLCFHDINVKPMMLTNYYRPDDNTVNYLHEEINLINFEDFIKINGYSNLYIGKYFLNDDFKRRIDNQKLSCNKHFYFEKGNTDCFKEINEDNDNNNESKELNECVFEDDIDILVDGFDKLDDFNEYVKHPIPSDESNVIYINCPHIPIFLQ